MANKTTSVQPKNHGAFSWTIQTTQELDWKSVTTGQRERWIQIFGGTYRGGPTGRPRWRLGLDFSQWRLRFISFNKVPSDCEFDPSAKPDNDPYSVKAHSGALSVMDWPPAAVGSSRQSRTKPEELWVSFKKPGESLQPVLGNPLKYWLSPVSAS